jgi:hypothetical protein
VAEEVFIYIVLKDAFDLGWRRISQYVDHIPETDKDRDYARVQRLVGAMIFVFYIVLILISSL